MPIFLCSCFGQKATKVVASFSLPSRHPSLYKLQREKQNTPGMFIAYRVKGTYLRSGMMVDIIEQAEASFLPLPPFGIDDPLTKTAFCSSRTIDLKQKKHRVPCWSQPKTEEDRVRETGERVPRRGWGLQRAGDGEREKPLASKARRD